ncbi:hypothetical protein [Pedobacter sp. SYSU D00535]|uniref:hypothetical protein n=1 Tax=Pedobacter sp. SYSU D00535 TaxID=2810308 RepID=UPI001A956690|nr:hypothetical protein [Pedobacter sp. SYSU D00535]
MLKISIFLFFLGLTISVMAQPVLIKNFIVKESLTKNDKLAIIAADENETPLEEIDGTFTFTINGFKQELLFRDGVAVPPQQIDKSTFVYLKHRNDSTSSVKLYYVIKKNEGLNPIKVSLKLLLLIPLALVVIASIFKRFLLFVAAILIGLFYFSTSKGLSISSYLDTIIEALKSFMP